jgi:lipid A ethanolaminephosphotransferase
MVRRAYRIAPAVQREVPMLVWLSAGLKKSAGLSRDCLQQGAAGAVSHDNLFHSVLGLLDVRSVVREPSLDLFSPCRGVDRAPLLAQVPLGDAASCRWRSNSSLLW